MLYLNNKCTKLISSNKSILYCIFHSFIFNKITRRRRNRIINTCNFTKPPIILLHYCIKHFSRQMNTDSHKLCTHRTDCAVWFFSCNHNRSVLHNFKNIAERSLIDVFPFIIFKGIRKNILVIAIMIYRNIMVSVLCRYIGNVIVYRCFIHSPHTKIFGYIGITEYPFIRIHTITANLFVIHHICRSANHIRLPCSSGNTNNRSKRLIPLIYNVFGNFRRLIIAIIK